MKEFFNKYLADDWAVVRTWWSIWVGILSAVLLTGIPVLADSWPNLAPGFIALFPKNGEQVAPVISVLLTIAARLISQRAVLEQLRSLFRRKEASNDEKQ